MKSPFRNVTVRSLTIILLSILLIVGGCEGKAWLERQRFYRFDPVTWAKAKRSDRYCMARYLLDHRTLIGKTRTEIITMLGEPDVDKIRLLYDLGPERGSAFRVDNDWLDIRFNDPKELVVTEVFIRPD